MRKLFIFIFLLTAFAAKSQTSGYVGNIGGWNHDWFIDMDILSDGSLIMTTDGNSRHWYDFYGLSKINNRGNTEWNFDFLRKNIASVEYLVKQTVVDDEDYIYSLIYVIHPTVPTTVNGSIVYPGLNLFKISPSGNVVWIKNIGNIGNEISGLLYKNGHIYVLGVYNGNLTFENGISFDSNFYYQCYMWMYVQGTDYFLAKYDAGGNFINAISFGEDYPDVLTDAAIDDEENIYITGVSNDFPCVSNYSHLTKIDKDLDIQWQEKISFSSDSQGFFIPTNVHFSKNKRIYIWGNIVLTSNIIECYCDPNWGGSVPFLLEYDFSGTFCRKLRINTCTTEFTMDINYKMRLPNGYMEDFQDDLIIHTVYMGEMVIGDTTIVSQIDEMNDPSIIHYRQSLLLIKINLESFTPAFIDKFDGERAGFYFDFPGKVIIDKDNLYISGTFSEKPFYVFGNTINNNSGNGCTDVFYCKINTDMVPRLTGIGVPSYSRKDIQLYPNPCTTVLNYSCNTGINKVQIFDITGHLIDSQNIRIGEIRVAHLSRGTYMLLFYNANQLMYKKLVIKK